MNPFTIGSDFDRIFHPRRLAIVGVSAQATDAGFGSGMLRALTAMGFDGEILPVNPKGGTLAGHTLYASIDDIPGVIDFAIIAVSAKHVPDVLEACLRKGAAGAEILSSGFREVGTPEGEALEKRIEDIAAKGIRVVGPNCFGIYCPKSGLTLLPGPDLSRQSGPVALLSQSGGLAIDMAHTGKWMGIGFSKVVSFGNGADLRETDLLHYLADDPETGVIALYLEGIRDGRPFLRALDEASRRKPVIVYKGGLSEAGARSVASHTASMGGSRIIWKSVLKQANATQVYDTQELADACLAFSRLPHKVYRGISLIGGGGALGVAACDLAERYGLDVLPLRPDLQETVLALLPRPGSSAINPVDVANPFVPPATLQAVLLAAALDDHVDLQILVTLLYHYKALAHALGLPIGEVAPYAELARSVREAVDQTGKPVVIVMPNPKRGKDDLDVLEMMVHARRAFVDQGLAVFDELHAAVRAIGHVAARKKTS